MEKNSFENNFQQCRIASPVGGRVILASNSPRRRELLAMIAPQFEVEALMGVDESYPAELPAAEVPEYLSRLKSGAYTGELAEGDVLITADTVVIVDCEILGKLQGRDEAYRQLNRQIAAMTANLFQVMRIFEPSWEKRTEAICDIANMMNMAVAGTPEEQKDYVNASLYEAFNIPELCEKSSWLGGITGDSGDEWENMAGRVVQFTRNRVEKELDTCPWDIVGSELCNMTTSMFTANFDHRSRAAAAVPRLSVRSRGRHPRPPVWRQAGGLLRAGSAVPAIRCFL